MSASVESLPIYIPQDTEIILNTNNIINDNFTPILERSQSETFLTYSN